jgi:hypothetical protein
MADDSVPPTPFKRAQVGRRARKSEEKAAKQEGGRRVPGSGSRPQHRAKGDIRANGFLIQDKFTDAKSFRLTDEDLSQIEAQAFAQGVLPSMRITTAGHRIRTFREEDALYLIAQAQGAEG